MMFTEDKDQKHSQFHWQIRRQLFLRFVARLLLALLFICSLSFLLFHTSGCAAHRPDSITFRGCKVRGEPVAVPLVGCECNSIVWMVDAKDKHHRIALCAK